MYVYTINLKFIFLITYRCRFVSEVLENFSFRCISLVSCHIELHR